ncbi:hypothetical protein TKK_0010450 [Trichogramma kaykai]|uniref:Very-long-chain (3R)-3-hydroxyacyl-CoA dehydratase n=1 Tax=Trichogramma kaykai TaxID=54128 RepID=A0ABD2WXM0_9HYME
MANNKTGKVERKNSLLVKIYLLAYNFLQVVGWSYILYQLVNFYYKNEHEKNTLWNNVHISVIIFQNAAALEIIHAVFGLVKSNPVVTTFQVLSRVMVVCGVIIATPVTYAAASPGLPLALFAWSITEIIRYGYYFANLVGHVPHFLVWLRYTTFIVLYPIGVTGELLCFYAATKYTNLNQKAYSYTLPNTWNFTFSYHYFLIIVMLLYIPLFPQLYLHMFSQRKKALGANEKISKKVN